MPLEPCEKCGSGRVAAVVDLRIARSPKPGNKYRTRCIACQNWLKFTGAAKFQNAERQRALPADVDPKTNDCTIPIEEADLTGFDIAGIDQRAVADGGSVEDVDDVEEDEEPENEFDCPRCGTHVTGFPDECPECPATYNWESDGEDDESQ